MTNPIYEPPNAELKAKLDKLENIKDTIHAKNLIIQANQQDLENLEIEKRILEHQTRGLYRKGVEL